MRRLAALAAEGRPPPEDLVSAAVREKWRSALASSETVTARHRRDLSGAVVP